MAGDADAAADALNAELSAVAATLWRAFGCPPGDIDPLAMATKAAIWIARMRTAALDGPAAWMRLYDDMQMERLA